MKQSKKSRLPKKTAVTKTANGRSSKEDITISEDFKKQLLGFLISIFGLMICLSVLSYSAKEQATLERLSFLSIFKKESYSAAFVTYNWLGIAGVYLSDFLVNNFFGYFSLIISIIFLAFGVTLIAKKPLGRTVQFSIYASLLMMMTASMFALLRIFS